jgi:signal transduction histidine kinase
MSGLYPPTVLLAAVAGTGVAFLAWLSRDQPGARPLALLLLAASFWAVADGLSVAATSGTLFWTRVGLVLSGFVPLAWLVTMVEYTGLPEHLTLPRVALLLVEPVVFAGLVWTNGLHGLVWTDAATTAVGGFDTVVIAAGPAVLAHQVYSLAVVAAGVALLVGLLLRSDGVYRARSTPILLGIAAPVAATLLSVAGQVPSGTDLTGTGYVFAGVVVAVVTFRRDLLSLAPVARELGRQAAISDFTDPIITVDGDGRIVDANEAALALFETDDPLGRQLSAALPDLDAVTDGAELRLERDATVRYYDVGVSELYRGYGAFTGRLITLRDVTERRLREQRLDVFNRLLRHNLRNELNVVHGNVELAREETDDEATRQRLADAAGTVETIVGRSDKIGSLSRTVESDADGPVDLARLLRADDRITRPPVTVDLPDRLPVAAGPSLAVAFAELVDNAIRHDDGEPSVRVAVDEAESDADTVAVTVSDTGPGIDEHEWRIVVEGEETPLRHTSGIGLWLVNWVVERCGGELAVENTATGCTVTLWLPRATPEDVGPAPPEHSAAARSQS